MQIEPATIDDLDSIVEAWMDLACDQRQYGSHLLPHENRTAIRMRLTGHVVDETLLVARTPTGSIEGFVMFELETGAFEQDATRGMIYNVFVAPNARNRGLGSSLLEAAEDRLTDAGADIIALEVLAKNEDARRLYRRRGYQPHRIEFEREAESDTHTKEDG